MYIFKYFWLFKNTFFLLLYIRKQRGLCEQYCYFRIPADLFSTYIISLKTCGFLLNFIFLFCVILKTLISKSFTTLLMSCLKGRHKAIFCLRLTNVQHDNVHKNTFYFVISKIRVNLRFIKIKGKNII